MTLAEYYDRVSRACSGSLLTLSRETDYHAVEMRRHWVATAGRLIAVADSPEKALYFLLASAELHHRDRAEWHRAERNRVAQAIDELEGEA